MLPDPQGPRCRFGNGPFEPWRYAARSLSEITLGPRRIAFPGWGASFCSTSISKRSRAGIPVRRRSALGAGG